MRIVLNSLEERWDIYDINKDINKREAATSNCFLVLRTVPVFIISSLIYNSVLELCSLKTQHSTTSTGSYNRTLPIKISPRMQSHTEFLRKSSVHLVRLLHTHKFCLIIFLLPLLRIITLAHQIQPSARRLFGLILSSPDQHCKCDRKRPYPWKLCLHS